MRLPRLSALPARVTLLGFTLVALAALSPAQGFFKGKSRTRLLKLGTSQIEPSTLGGTIALGGGVDIPIGKRFAFRAIQADYLNNSAFGSRHGDVRYSSGIVVVFGKKSPPPSF
jgi:hypothetical protein